jgi:pSer/pThr/pTyr-binding forkhead associated (FHA) protein
MPGLVGISDSFKGKSFVLEGDEVSLGRRDENQIVISDSSVSGNHASLVRQEAGWLLKDLGSTNGTRVNGLTIEETLLQERDQVQFGSMTFLFTGGSPDEINADEITLQTDVPDIELTAELAVKPDTFSSHSPFAAQKQERKGVWNSLLLVIGGVAVLGVLALLYILFFTG